MLGPESENRKRCLKCGYERKPEDTAPEYACPECGAVYYKVSGSTSDPKGSRRHPTPRRGLGSHKNKDLKTCRTCGEEVAENAKQCPHCGERKPYISLSDQISTLLAALIVGWFMYILYTTD